MIISRYLLKEVLLALIAITGILLLIFLSNQLVRYLSYAAAGKIAASFVLQMLLYEVPYLLALLLPLGFYLGTILAYGRFYAENEMAVLNASGYGIKQLIRVTTWFALLLSLVVLVLMLWVNPYIEKQKNIGIANDNLVGTLRPGRFQVINDGHTVFYAEKISHKTMQANNIFLAEEPKSEVLNSKNWVVVSAANGRQAKNHAQQKFIISTDGYRYDGKPGQNSYKVIQFKQYAVRLPEGNVATSRQPEEAISTLNLFKHYRNPHYAAELQWRLAMPISIFILMMFGMALCQVKPRQGRYTPLIPAILIYIVYVNLLFMSRSWVEQKMIPVALGMWWVHLLLFATSIILLLRYENKYFHSSRFFQRFRKQA